MGGLSTKPRSLWFLRFAIFWYHDNRAQSYGGRWSARDSESNCYYYHHRYRFVIDVSDNDANVCSQDISVQSTVQCTRTDPLQSLPCSVCFANDGTVHLAVAAGIVSIGMTAVFIPKTSTSSQKVIKKASKRSLTKARWLTSELEIQRRRAIDETESKKNEENKMEKSYL